MQVRLDRDVAAIVRREARKNRTSFSREATKALAMYYATRRKR